MAAWKPAAAVALLGGLLAALYWLAFAGRTPLSGTAVIGDKAPALRAAMGLSDAVDPARSAVLIVSVEDWWKLRYVSDMKAVCGEACSGDTGLVRVVELSPRGSRKLLFVNLAAWPGTLDAPPDMACLAGTLAEERAQLGAADLPACAGAVPVQAGTRWRLPLGLGAV